MIPRQKFPEQFRVSSDFVSRNQDESWKVSSEKTSEISEEIPRWMPGRIPEKTSQDHSWFLETESEKTRGRTLEIIPSKNGLRNFGRGNP